MDCVEAVRQYGVEDVRTAPHNQPGDYLLPFALEPEAKGKARPGKALGKIEAPKTCQARLVLSHTCSQLNGGCLWLGDGRRVGLLHDPHPARTPCGLLFFIAGPVTRHPDVPHQKKHPAKIFVWSLKPDSRRP